MCFGLEAQLLGLFWGSQRSGTGRVSYGHLTSFEPYEHEQIDPSIHVRHSSPGLVREVQTMFTRLSDLGCLSGWLEDINNHFSGSHGDL